MCVLGMAGEFRSDGIAFNALWPRTVIATAAVQNLLGGDATIRGSRTPEIMADAAHVILTRPSRECTGQLLRRRRRAALGGRDRPLEVPDGPRRGAHSGLLRLSRRAWTRAKRARCVARSSTTSGRSCATSSRPTSGGASSSRSSAGRTAAPVVAGMDVEELFGDEARVDAGLRRGARARRSCPCSPRPSRRCAPSTSWTSTTCAAAPSCGCPASASAGCPALVRAPSARLDGERDELVAKLRAKNDAFHERFGRPARRSPRRRPRQREGRLVRRGEGAARRRARRSSGRSRRARARGAGAAPTRTPPSRCGARRPLLVDSIEERDLWELSTPVFATDELTAWAVAAFVCDRVKGDAVVCVPDPRGSCSFCCATSARRATRRAARDRGQARPRHALAALRGEVGAQDLARDDVGLHLPGRPVDDERSDGDLTGWSASGCAGAKPVNQV